MVAVPTNVAMMQARTTDGDKPAIKAYAHSKKCELIGNRVKHLAKICYKIVSSCNKSVKHIKKHSNYKYGNGYLICILN